MTFLNVLESLINIISELLPDTNAKLPFQILRDFNLIGENVSQSLYFFFNLKLIFIIVYPRDLGLKNLPLLIERSIQPFAVLAPLRRVLEARSPWYPMMATETRPSGARHLLLEQKGRKEINREAYGTMSVTLTRRITFLAS